MPVKKPKRIRYSRRPTPLTVEEVARRRAAREKAEPPPEAKSVEEKRQERRRRRRAQKAIQEIEQRGNKHQKNRISLLWGRYQDYDAFVVGTGTSLAGFNFEALSGRKGTITIGLNDAVLAKGFVPDFSLFCDVGIWSRYRDFDLDEKTTMVCQPRARNQFMRYERCSFKDRVWHFNHVGSISGCRSNDNDDLFVARTVATGGIMMAWKMGARRVFLLGVDGYKVESDKEGGTYYHDGRGKGKENRKEKKIDGGRVVQDRHEWWQKNMDELRQWFDQRKVYQEKWRGSNVYNLSGRSTIGAWQKLKVKTVLGAGAFRV